jgi:hypothetical protein
MSTPVPQNDKAREAILKVDELLLDEQRKDPSIVLDGAIDIDRYLKAMPRILWILKEPHGKGPWDLREYFRSSLFTYNRWQQTAALIRVSKGLLDGRIPWGAWTNDARSIADCLRDVAVININKRGGDARADWNRLYQAGIDLSELICQQVVALDPQLVLLAGTWDFLPRPLKSQLHELDNADNTAARIGNTVYMRAYHPNQSTIPHEQYYTRICTCLANHSFRTAGGNATAF